MSTSSETASGGASPAPWNPFKRFAGPPGWYPRPTNTQQERQYQQRLRFGIFVAIAVALIALTEQFARPATDQLSFSTTWSIALAYAVPILMPAMGGIFAERAGVVNIGLEGMLILGTWFGAWGALEFGPWWGMLIGAAGGASEACCMPSQRSASASTTSSRVPRSWSWPRASPDSCPTRCSQAVPAGASRSPPVSRVWTRSAFRSSPAGPAPPTPSGASRAGTGFWISDAAGIFRGFLWNVSWLTLIAYATVPISVWLLWRTSFGLRLRSCGEHPIAADSLGVDVYRYKYYGVVLSGAFAGYGGAFLVIELTGIYREGQTAGRGLHRPGHDHLRQLAAGRRRLGRAAVRVRRHAAVAATGPRSTGSCCSSCSPWALSCSAS